VRGCLLAKSPLWPEFGASSVRRGSRRFEDPNNYKALVGQCELSVYAWRRSLVSRSCHSCGRPRRLRRKRRFEQESPWTFTPSTGSQLPIPTKKDRRRRPAGGSARHRPVHPDGSGGNDRAASELPEQGAGRHSGGNGQGRAGKGVSDPHLPRSLRHRRGPKAVHPHAAGDALSLASYGSLQRPAVRECCGLLCLLGLGKWEKWVFGVGIGSVERAPASPPLPAWSKLAMSTRSARRTEPLH
jgi:hypothetical protein